MDIYVQFLHPTDGRLLTVSLDDSITAQEAIAELIAADFIVPNPDGYGLAIKGGNMIGISESFSNAGVKDNDSIRVLPVTSAGGGTYYGGTSGKSNIESDNFETSIPGLRKNIRDTFTIRDIASSPQAITMIVHLYDDLQLKYERQTKQLEYERMRPTTTLYLQCYC